MVASQLNQSVPEILNQRNKSRNEAGSQAPPAGSGGVKTTDSSSTPVGERNIFSPVSGTTVAEGRIIPVQRIGIHVL